MRDRRLLTVAAAVLVLAAFTSRHPTADIRVMTHEAGDPAPGRMRAAIDLGLIGVSVLYTWTIRRVAATH